MEDRELQQLVQAEVKRYVRGMSLRYLPVLAGIAAILLLVLAVPDVQQQAVQDQSTLGQSQFGAQSGTPLSSAAGQGSATGPVGAATTASGGNTGNDSTGPATTSGAGANNAGTSTGQADTTATATGPTGTTGPAGNTTGTTRATTGSKGTKPAKGAKGSATAAATGGPTAASATGIAINGTICGSGIRQFTFSNYAPLCVPKFTGNNGGATAHGVTATTITLDIRDSTDFDTIKQAAGSPPISDWVTDAQTLAAFFNKQFELYGRQVVVKSFVGKGSYVSEAGGQDQAGAATDAQTAYDAGAFADPFEEIGTYGDALAAKHLVNFELGSGLAGIQKNAPYTFEPSSPINEDQGSGMADLLCQRMKGLPAEFSSDAVTQKTTRKFGVIEPNQPSIAGGAAKLVALAKSECGVTVEVQTYAISTADYPTESAQIMTQLHADGVTTVFALADPLMDTFLTNSANTAQYYPEWVMGEDNVETAIARASNAKEVSSMIFMSYYALRAADFSTYSCSKIYQLANPGGTPASGHGVDDVCADLLAFYGAVQNAGPDLTPTTFAQGWNAMPDSGPGEFGSWTFANRYSPISTYNLETYDASQPSPYYGGNGLMVACKEPETPWLNGHLGSGQLHCFGK